MKRVSIISFLVVVGFSCTKQKANEEPVDCSGPAKSFAIDVVPVFQVSCTNGSGCHGNGSNNGPGPLLNYTQIFDHRVEIRSAVASGHMPLNGSLTASQKNAILCWIDSGAPGN
jgi:hypothetical protein